MEMFPPIPPEDTTPRTLRGMGFTGCEHPLHPESIAFEGGPQHCPFCGGIRNGDAYSEGSIDYKIDLVVRQLMGKDIYQRFQSYLKCKEVLR